MMGVELSQISLLYYLSYMNAAGSFEKLIEAREDCGQGLKIKVNIQILNTGQPHRFFNVKCALLECSISWV